MREWRSNYISNKKILVDNKIAFLDIMKNAIRLENNSEDEKIKMYSLDVDSFRNLPESVFFICNSRAAERDFRKICKKIGRELIFCEELGQKGISQGSYGYLTQSMRRKSKEEREELKNKWVNAIQAILSIR